MAHRSQCSSFGDVDQDPGHVPPHYKEYYRIAIDILAEEGIDAYYRFLAAEQEVDFLNSTEIEHINKHLKKPVVPLDCLEYNPSTYEDSDSSGTYWPMHTDIAAPVLDLGWPSVHSFRGPSDVTIFVHPPAPDALSIKDEVRRLIRSATQVIAIVMDVFTDIDLFEEVLEAASRGIAVYLLLDEMLSHHFLDMVKKCQVNLSHVHFLRVRTLVGSTYLCRSGISFTGNLIERFLLVDSNAVLCGSYSFMWSFEKIHRSIVQRFQGELVAIFDEEFRILYAQSRPLLGLEYPEPAMENYYSVARFQHGGRPQPKPGHIHRQQEDILSQHSSHSWAEPDLDADRLALMFRQDGEERRFMEGVGIRGYAQQLCHFQQDHTSSAMLRAKRLEMSSFKRRSYAEGTGDCYGASGYRYGRIAQHYDELDVRSEHLFREKPFPLEPGLMRERFNSFNAKLGVLDRLRQSREDLHLSNEHLHHMRHGYQQRNFEEAFLSGYPLQPPLVSYEHSGSSKDVRHGSELDLESEGRLGLKAPKRPNIGQSYACQKSPTQKQVLDPRSLFQESGLGRKSEDQPTKLGLRKWRLGSYLSDHPGVPEEDTSAAGEVPAGSGKEGDPCESTLIRDLPQFTSYKHLDLYSKLQKVDSAEDLSSDQGNGEQIRKLAKHASLRSKLNPLQQRGSRLRSSLIFNSTKLEQHVGQKGRRVLSIREQLQTGEVKESKEQEQPGAMEAEGTGITDHQPAAGRTVPDETAAPSRTEPDALPLPNPEPKQEPAQQQEVSPKPRQKLLKLDLQLSQKVQDALNKMTQRSITPRTAGPLQPDKHLEPPVEMPPVLQPRPDPALKPGVQPSELDATPPPPPPAEGTSSGSPAKVKLHSHAVENGEEAGGAASDSQTTPKASPEEQRLPHHPGDRKTKESPISPGQRPSAVASTESEKGPEKTLMSNHNEAVEREEKPHRSPIHPVPAKATSTSQGGWYSNTTSNVIYSSNLRDDTKVILEQISANSQKNRAENAKAQLAPANEADDLKATADAEKTDAGKKLGFHSLMTHKGSVPNPPDHTDPLIKKMDSFRKERRVYSRFEVFYKKDEPLKTEGDPLGQQDSKGVDGADKKKTTKFIPRFLGTLRKF
ncbi:protein FAM83H-like [Hypanus sabinus]|uniref:protein FAM83H-like n=1 Tax=Hypanus sabinus TaxID=79690 RepID=UPI0028C50F7D|nr:protein FAM83H-like [Hypanus sabinus]